MKAVTEDQLLINANGFEIGCIFGHIVRSRD